MKVVFDTNILVSALAIPGGVADAAMRKVLDGTDVLLISKPLMAELLRVLGGKFSRDIDQLAHTAVFLDDLAEVVEPGLRLHVLRDEADNRVLECAIAGGAEMIVTGDRAMLQLRRYRAVQIISLPQYVVL